MIVLGKTVPQPEVDQVVSDLADRYQRNPVFRQQVDLALKAVWQSKFEHWSGLGTLVEIK